MRTSAGTMVARRSAAPSECSGLHRHCGFVHSFGPHWLYWSLGGGSAVQLYGWTAVNSASHLGIPQVSGQYRELGGAIHSGAAYVLEQATSHIGNSTQAAVRDAVIGRPSLDKKAQ